MYLTHVTRCSLRGRSANNNAGCLTVSGARADTNPLCSVIESKVSVAEILSALKAARLSITDNVIEGVHWAVKTKHGSTTIVDYYIEGEEIENKQTLRYFQALQTTLPVCITEMIASFFISTPCFRQTIMEIPHEYLLFSLEFKNIALVVRAGIYMNEVRDAMICLNDSKMLTDETRLAIQQAGKDAVKLANELIKNETARLASLQLDTTKLELTRRNNKSLLFKDNNGLHPKKLNTIASKQVTDVRRITGS